MTDGNPWVRADGQPIIPIARAAYFAKLHYRLRHRLPMWVVYRPTTAEYSGLWVARMHVTLPEPKPTRFVMAHVYLKSLRRMLPPGTVNIGRQPDDVQEIEEVWI